MSWRLSYQSVKVLFSYVMPYKVKTLRDAIFDGNVQAVREVVADRPKLLQQSVDADGNTALGIQIFSIIRFSQKRFSSLHHY
jgi:hypothetical protein